MAIYSCNLASVGRTTHAAGTAGAHIRYIARADASAVLLSERMPEDPAAARAFLDTAEEADRKNARVIDKIRLALPRELDEAQRAALVRTFMHDLTGGRVPWFAGIHQTGDDARNPHAHIAVRDRDIETGKRVLRLSDSARDRQSAGLMPKAVEWVRERWEHHANTALEQAGSTARIDRRSLEAQGIDRAPTIHVGPRAQHIDGRVSRPVSKPRTDGRGRVIDYPAIDAGRTRSERHAEIVDMNLERAARSPDFETRARALFEREQRAKDGQLEGRLVAEARRRTENERRQRKAHHAKITAVQALRTAERRAVLSDVRERFAPAAVALKAEQAQERAALDKQQGLLWRRFLAAVDVTGRTRQERQATKTALAEQHRAERAVLSAQAREARRGAVRSVEATHGPILAALYRDRARVLVSLDEEQKTAMLWADRQRQEREAVREQGLNALTARIAAWKTAQRMTQRSREQGRGFER